ncbi:hypothetical protein EYF80_066986 [Liparis tanakae]|uniref:Uncharacterized protein n=1 Tax=Liparis tanakae TaxID=230148 RepID=A0A4Z2E299_9TELE|nr:hypothetical protein EYF80_066986 [Liparis tanakae]
MLVHDKCAAHGWTRQGAKLLHPGSQPLARNQAHGSVPEYRWTSGSSLLQETQQTGGGRLYLHTLVQCSVTSHKTSQTIRVTRELRGGGATAQEIKAHQNNNKAPGYSNELGGPNLCLKPDWSSRGARQKQSIPSTWICRRTAFIMRSCLFILNTTVDHGM